MTDLSNDAVVLDDPAGRVLKERSPVRDETILMSFDPGEIGVATGVETYEIETLAPSPVSEIIDAWHGPELFSIVEDQPDLTGEEFRLRSPALGSIRLSATGESAGALSLGQRVLASRQIAETGRHLLRNVRLWFEEDPNVSPQEIDLLLPLLRLHRPNRQGCSAVCKTAKEETEKVEGNFEVAGMGGGGEQVFTKSLENVYRAEESCKEVAVPASCTIRFGTTILDETPVSYGTRIEIDRVHAKTTVVRALPADLDLCREPNSANLPGEDHIARDNPPSEGDASEHSSIVKASGSGFVTVGLGLATPPIKMSTKLTRSLSNSYELTTKLIGGADYRSFAPSPTNPFELCWAVL